jgi:hypothetical protein
MITPQDFEGAFERLVTITHKAVHEALNDYMTSGGLLEDGKLAIRVSMNRINDRALDVVANRYVEKGGWSRVSHRKISGNPTVEMEFAVLDT